MIFLITTGVVWFLMLMYNAANPSRKSGKIFKVNFYINEIRRDIMTNQNLILIVILIAILVPILYYIIVHILIPLGLLFKMRSNTLRSQGGKKRKYLK